jgi:DNA-3-methyladenine glycosylase II
MTKISEKTIEHLKKDKVLKNIINKFSLPKRGKRANVYDSLIASIVSQQLSVKAAGTIYQRFLSLYNNKTPLPEEILRTTEDEMRYVGLSFQKAGYMKNLAEYFTNKPVENKYWKKLNDEEIIKELTQIKGIGTWTVQMMLMFDLGREDVLPVDDLIIRNSIKFHYKIKTDIKKEELAEINKVADKWRPYRSIACLYFWASKELIL